MQVVTLMARHNHSVVAARQPDLDLLRALDLVQVMLQMARDSGRVATWQLNRDWVSAGPAIVPTLLLAGMLLRTDRGWAKTAAGLEADDLGDQVRTGLRGQLTIDLS